VIRKLNLEESDVEVVLAGGVFQGKGPLLLDTVAQVVHQVAPRAGIVRPRSPSVVGAVLLALEEVYGALSAEILGKLERSLRRELRTRPEQDVG
jgi:hypothetical protein